jgi:VanZ family protein
MKKHFFKLIPYWKTFLWTGVILYLCLLPAKDVKKIDILKFDNADKLVHFSMYFILSFLLLYDSLSVRQIKPSKVISFFYLPFTITLVLGGSIELIQYFFIDSRDGSIFDMLANLIGMLLGTLTFQLFLHYRKIS